MAGSLCVAFLCARLCLWWGAVACWACLGTLVVAGAVTAVFWRCGLCSRRVARGVGVALACGVVCLGACGAALHRLEAGAAALAQVPVATLELRVRGYPSQGSQGWRCRAEAAREGRTLGEVWLLCDQELEPDLVVCGVGRFSPLESDDFGRASRARGLCGTVRLFRVSEVRDPEGWFGALQSVRTAVAGLLDPAQPGHALFLGMVLGDRRGLQELGLSEEFSRAGLAHLVAVSGMHLTLVTGLLARVIRPLELRPGLRGALLALGSGAYVALCAVPLSALRSWLMGVAAFGARAARRRSSALASLCAVALACVLVRPAVTGELGFCLSVACVASLCAVGPLLENWIEAAVPRLPAWMIRRSWGRRVQGLRRGATLGLAAGLACALASAPLCASSFGRVSLASPVAGTLLGPLFLGFVTLGLPLVCLGALPLVGPAALEVLGMLGDLLCEAAGRIAGLPLASVPVALSEPWATLSALAVVAVLWAWWPRPLARRRLWALAGCVVLVAAGSLVWLRWHPQASVTVLDVGQGDAVLVRDGPHAVLVDTGPDDAVAAALVRQGVTALDAVVITHQHDDHVSGLAALSGLVAVECAVVPEGTTLAPEASRALTALGCPVEEVGPGDAWSVGRWRLRVLWPQTPQDGSENCHSLCLAVTWDGSQETWGLLTGDAESDVLQELVPSLGPVRLLKVGHHGSAAALTADEAQALAPLVAVASAGRDNPYGHPSLECQDVLGEVGAVFLCTSQSGDVEVRPAGDGVQVCCQRACDAMAYD